MKTFIEITHNWLLLRLIIFQIQIIQIPQTDLNNGVMTYWVHALSDNNYNEMFSSYFYR